MEESSGRNREESFSELIIVLEGELLAADQEVMREGTQLCEEVMTTGTSERGC